MKTKVVLLIAICSIATLSFTFTSNRKSEKTTVKAERVRADDAPAGGFLSTDDKS